MIEPVGGHGGMDYYDFGLCDGLSHSGVEVILYTCDETNEPDQASFVIRRWYRGIYGRSHVALRGLRFLFATLRVFWDVLVKRIPIVHFHFFDVGVLQLGLIVLAKTMLRKVVVTVHDVEGFVEGKGNSSLARLAYRWPDKLIVHNQFSRAELMAHLNVTANRVAVIPHGNYRHVYPSPLSRTTARQELGWNQKENVLLFFGQIKGVKRLDLLLSAFALVLKAQPNTRLVIAGKVVDVPFSTYQSQIDTLGIATQCTCLIRYIKNEEVPLLYGASDAVVLPYERIYQSGVLLMAMSFAKAVLVSSIPGMLEIVRDEETGFVFKNGDPVDLAARLVTVLAEPEKRGKVAQQGLQLMDDEYSWYIVGELTNRLYKDVIHNV